ncbi:MAG: CopG family antitoxin [Desulfoferrobacter sp.]
MKKDSIDPIPEHFASAEEAGEFWDTHDFADYWDETRASNIRFNLKSRHYLIGLAPKIAQELQRIAEAEGVSAETIANLWLQEKLQERGGEKLNGV